MGLELFNKRSRPQLFQRLSREPFDLLIIGGGITGASIFRDAVLRGMRVALLEAKDFAAGTSGRSSKLIHGGLRYLKNLGFRMAWESCHERNLHIRLNKRLVRPLPFLVPLYRGQGESRAMMRFGMWLYEMMSGFQNHRFHQFLSREETLLMAPGIPVEGLIGGCLYYDAVVSDSRWTIEIAKDGVRHGGLAVNYTPVTGLLTENSKIIGVTCHDRIGGATYEVHAKVVVNATGVFADGIRKLDRADAPNLIKLSKGTHLVFAEEDVPLTVTTVFSSPIDERPLFLVKREGCFLFGTSDDWEDAAPDAPLPGERDVAYLLLSLAQFMPEANLGREKVQFVYSGFRPLLLGNGKDVNPASASREDLIEVAPSGLISVVGGKLTTARIMALRVLKHVLKKIGASGEWGPCQTHKRSIGGTNEEVAEGLAYWARQCPQLTGHFRILYQRYGLDAHDICAKAMKIFLGKHPDPRAEPIRAEVQYVCRNEMVCTLEDLIDRRAGFLYWNPEKRLERLRYGAYVIRKELDLTEEEFEAQYRDYQAHLKRFHTLPGKKTSCI
ncbi:glycerol-3-phosphate dehydrogenase/oxidase [Candidatus Poribacteria bacterium]|nr:glycerol-3-phosphate dehydrogenase/oxidase [Candidatus Poribacteria bacterium]